MDHKLNSYKNFSYTLVTQPLELTVDDSGCTSRYLPSTCPCDNKVPVLYGGNHVGNLNGVTMVASQKALLPLPQLYLASQKCDVFPELQQPLLYLGQF